MIRQNHESPSIKVFLHPKIKNTMIRDVLLGIEEEGVPFQVCTDENHSAIDLSYQACLASPLGVGVGIDDNENACVHYVSLEKNNPLFCANLTDGNVNFRALGSNAARLVKGLPFKSLEITETNSAEQIDGALLKEKIATIVKRILAEKAKEV